jgi:fucose permease
VLLIGCGFAPVFPVLFGVTGDRYPHLSGTALGLALGMALMGGMSLPYATGVLAGAYGLRGAFVIVPASLVGMAILFAILRPRLARVESPS